MYCSTCGAVIPPGRLACSECGSPVPRSLQNGGDAASVTVTMRTPAAASLRAVAAMGRCPRCGYHGQGVSYFSRGSHIAGLVAATVLTSGAMGVGGLIFYVVRRDHQVCPRCGNHWGRYGERALVRAAPDEVASPEEAALPAAGSEGGRTAAAITLYALGGILFAAGLANLHLAPIVFALLFLAGGYFAQRAAREAREARRTAILAALQLPVLKLAAERGGRLTVTETAAAMGWTLPRAEKVLHSLDDGLRVNSEVTNEGVIVYEFRELIAAPPRRLPESREPQAPATP